MDRWTDRQTDKQTNTHRKEGRKERRKQRRNNATVFNCISLFSISGWDLELQQQMRKSYWCAPFTVTFGKRRKVCAIWNERCGAVPCTRKAKSFGSNAARCLFMPMEECNMEYTCGSQIPDGCGYHLESTKPRKNENICSETNQQCHKWQQRPFSVDEAQ